MCNITKSTNLDVYSSFPTLLTRHSCGTVALMVLGQFFWYLRTIGLRISPYQKLSKVRGENPPNYCHEKGSENDQTYMYRFVRYLSTFFYAYLPINNHFPLITITNISFVISPAYFVSHLATPVVSFLRSRDFSNYNPIYL
jgi:hypothetical protein